MIYVVISIIKFGSAFAKKSLYHDKFYNVTYTYQITIPIAIPVKITTTPTVTVTMIMRLTAKVEAAERK